MATVLLLPPDGNPVIKEFGNLSSKRRFSEIKGREPIVDVFERDHEIRVIAEFPGFLKKI